MPHYNVDGRYEGRTVSVRYLATILVPMASA